VSESVFNEEYEDSKLLNCVVNLVNESLYSANLIFNKVFSSFKLDISELSLFSLCYFWIYNTPDEAKPIIMKKMNMYSLFLMLLLTRIYSKTFVMHALEYNPLIARYFSSNQLS
jgi:hypothetical protein